MTDRKNVGRAGEDSALQFLLGKGLTLMERNWRHRHLEVDLIMLGDDGVHIVEVKSRTAPIM
ncbi:MAG: YraN family protein, partial [Alistipes sp.]|nr:YraN family protein [Candidatus Minthomonas equi]